MIMTGIIPFTEEGLVPAIVSTPAPWGAGKRRFQIFLQPTGPDKAGQSQVLSESI